MKKYFHALLPIALLFCAGCAEIIEDFQSSVNHPQLSQAPGQIPIQTQQSSNKNDPQKINTDGWEDSPYITPDGNELYFMYSPHNFFPIFLGGAPKPKGPERPGHHKNTQNPFEDSDIYVSYRQPAGWSAPQSMSLNDNMSNCCAMLNNQRNRMYLARPVPGKQGMDLFMYEKDANGSWGKALPIDPILNSNDHEDNPHISADERTIYFTSTRPGGFGKKDIWVSKKDASGRWAQPWNMGPAINTSGNEDQVWLNDGENVMYLTRNDKIYETRFENGNWTEPQKIRFGGKDIQAAEPSLTADMKRMYFAVPDIFKQQISIMYSDRSPNGSWGPAIPVD